MSTSATGQVLVDEDGTPLVGYTVVARHMSALFPSDLTARPTDGQGRFTLTYDGDFFVTEFGHALPVPTRPPLSIRTITFVVDVELPLAITNGSVRGLSWTRYAIASSLIAAPAHGSTRRTP